MLSKRQQLILTTLVDSHLASGGPVGSRAIAGRAEVSWGPSTVRAELGALEDAGYLTHPHTSAGRVPTAAGYRHYVDALLASEPAGPAGGTEFGLSRMRSEIDEAMRETSAALSRITDLMALVTAPPLASATIHRVEALSLQPDLVVLVIITSTGGVRRRVFRFEGPVDPGLVEWASSYLNESLSGMGLGARMITNRLADPELSEVEASFIARLGEAFRDLDADAEPALYVEGTARLLSEDHSADLPQVDELMRALEGRAAVLRVLRSALDERSVFLWIGAENPQPELRSVSVVGANYGLAHRNLGSVGVLGPLRMDYGLAIASVRGAARELSRYFESVYE